MRSRPVFVALLTSTVLAGVLLFARLPNDAVQNGVAQETSTATDPKDECFLQTPHWNFNWQRGYMYDAPMEKLPILRAGDKLRMRCTYDNTMGNPFVAEALQQHGRMAPADVTLGEMTLDEMCLGVFGLAYRIR